MQHTALLTITAFALLFSACSGQGANSTSEPQATADPDPAHNSNTSLDWAGTYTGTVPCADCEGIATSITLDRSGDYVMRTQYLGKSTEVYTAKGAFEWEADGNRIRLKGVDGGAARYQVGEGQLFQLDQEGERITGELPGNYILRKEASANAWPLLGTYWKLVEVMGKTVPHPEGRMPAHMVLNAEEKRVAGNAGCNSFFSTYELDEATSRLRFEQAGSTMMACPDMSIEDAFMKALQEVDNYSLADGKLSLNKARMAPLLRFEAVEM
jgi:copper homeostasis protein (lipoprotein)